MAIPPLCFCIKNNKRGGNSHRRRRASFAAASEFPHPTLTSGGRGGIGNVTRPARGPPGRLLPRRPVAQAGPRNPVPEDDTVCVWDVPSGQVKWKADTRGVPVRCAAFSPDGKYLLTGSANNSVALWDAAKGGRP